MKILGLTGSIGMGKSATAEMFAAAGVPVYDADAAVHALYSKGGAAVGPLSERFPECVRDGAVDRPALREHVLNDPGALSDLEQIVHPLARAEQVKFIAAAEENQAPLVLLDIPLLYETGGNTYCDYVAVVSAPVEIQRARILAREGMTEVTLDAIMAKQMPDAEKRARADFVISTAFGFDFTRAHVAAIIDLLGGPPEIPGDD